MGTEQERLARMHRRAGELQRKRDLSILHLWGSVSTALFLCLLMLSAAGLLQGNQHLGGLHQLGADNLLAFDNKGLGAYRLCIQSLGILDNQGGDFIGAGNDCTYFLLAAAAGGGNEGCTNSANNE